MLTHYSDLTIEQRYKVSAECSEYAQNHFVNTRKEEAERIKAQEVQGEGESQEPKVTLTDQHTFHHWLILSRLITVSQGAVVMTEDHFKEALELDGHRKTRAEEYRK